MKDNYNSVILKILILKSHIFFSSKVHIMLNNKALARTKLILYTSMLLIKHEMYILLFLLE